MKGNRSRGHALGACIVWLSSCGGEAQTPKEEEVTLEHCEFEEAPATAGAGGSVSALPIRAGTYEALLDVPVSTALGAYTSRAGFLGTAGKVDLREVEISGSFNESIGVESPPAVKVLYLENDEDRTAIVKLDLGLVYEGMLFDVERELGTDFNGKVIISASHSHAAWGQQSASFVFQVGLGPFRRSIYERYVAAIVDGVNQAKANAQAAKIGVFVDNDFDPDNKVSRDRRSENDEMMGGPAKDSRLFMLRVDSVDETPLAVVPIYGVHGTLMGADNSFASTEATGAAEFFLQEQFDDEVMVMHLQGAGGDVTPSGHGSLNCDKKPGNEDDPCFDWVKIEGHGRAAAPILYQAWQSAEAELSTDWAIEMMTRSIALGPDASTFAVRGGELEYAPFEVERRADREIYDDSGAIISPIDEFNAPVGASLCEADIDNPQSAYPLFPDGLMPGTDLLPPYGACVRIDAAASILGELLDLKAESVDATHPVCQSTRTNVSALRLGDFVFGTIPGELTVDLAERIRDGSPLDADKTVLLGYAQGHTGYCLSADDWLLGGYESSINVWGPLEGEYLGERLDELFDLALTSEREDAMAAGDTRVSTPEIPEDLPIDNPAPMAGSVPAELPERLWLRATGSASAQPDPQLPRVSGLARFVWIGDDPQVKTPVVTIERQVAENTFETVTRRSGRPVRGSDFLLSYTPQPLRRDGDNPQTHYWVAEWQTVPWTGMQEGQEALDLLSTRHRLPLGTYRFAVEGDGWNVTSEAFEVVPAELTVEAERDANTFDVSASLLADKGYRLLSATLPSNDPIPLANETFTVTLALSEGDPVVFTEVVANAQGVVTVDAEGNADNVMSITVQDAFGNSGILIL